jgi:hypothetical protein
MKLRHSNLLLAVVTLSGAAAMPAAGQTVAPTAGLAAKNGQQSSPSIPDLSGVWNHSIPGFEPLASGPTALVNQARRQTGPATSSSLSAIIIIRS